MDLKPVVCKKIKESFMAHLKARNGSKIYKGFEVPESAIIFTSKKGVEYYVVGQDFETGMAMIRYLDDGRYQEIDAVLISDKLELISNENNKYWKSKKQEKSKFNLPSLWSGL